MGDHSSAKGRDDATLKSPKLFMLLWIGLPLLIVVLSVLYTKFF